MEVARSKLSELTFDEIYAAAVSAERRAVESAPSLPSEDRVRKPALAAVIQADMQDLPRPEQPPHVVERLDQRVDLQIGENELGELKRMVRIGDRNSRILRTRLDTVIEAEVAFMGRHFTVIYNRTRDTLVTAFLKRKKKARLKVGPKKRDWRAEAMAEIEAVD
jgi:hypothetical protein